MPVAPATGMGPRHSVAACGSHLAARCSTSVSMRRATPARSQAAWDRAASSNWPGWASARTASRASRVVMQWRTWGRREGPGAGGGPAGGRAALLPLRRGGAARAARAGAAGPGRRGGRKAVNLELPNRRPGQVRRPEALGIARSEAVNRGPVLTPLIYCSYSSFSCWLLVLLRRPCSALPRLRVPSDPSAPSGLTGCPPSSGQSGEKTATRSVRTCY
jgi:hypothetical protein